MSDKDHTRPQPAVAGDAVAYLHTLSIEGGGERRRLTFSREWPFDDVSGVSGSTSTAELVFRAALAQDRASRIGINGQGDSPTRFVAFSADDEIIAAGADPQSVQSLAQDYAEAHKDEYVHLYQHAMSLRCSDGD